MSHPTGQAATLGFPEFQPMADVIDSLKRLERVGAENSKTTQKLIDAANSLEDLLVAQFPHQTRVEFRRAGETRGFGKPPYFLDYAIDDGHLVNQSIYRPVGADRTSAMRFAEDIADGLLDVIEAVLAEMQKEAAPAARVLQEALDAFPKKTEPPF